MCRRSVKRFPWRLTQERAASSRTNGNILIVVVKEVSTSRLPTRLLKTTDFVQRSYSNFSDHGQTSFHTCASPLRTRVTLYSSTCPTCKSCCVLSLSRRAHNGVSVSWTTASSLTLLWILRLHRSRRCSSPTDTSLWMCNAGQEIDVN